jgi:metallophosphoesterase (TIGR00282 family)
MNILAVGDVVGSPGRLAFTRVVSRLKEEGLVDVVVANAENAAGGRGLKAALAEELLGAGADVLTLGDHAWDQKEIRTYLDGERRVVRPANFAPGCPGWGWVTVNGQGTGVTVFNVIGRVFMRAHDCPFRTMDALLRDAPGLGRVILVDVHAEATSEKIVMGRYLDGRVSAVFGTHTHVQTSDETILPGGTAYITDLGMTGAKDSALGRDLDSVTSMFLTGMPSRFHIARKDVALEGVLIDVDDATGKARSIRRLRERPEP